MSENKKLPKNARLSAAASYTIGGKPYSGDDISRLRPQTKEVHAVNGMENAPRQVSKAVENQAGIVNTSVGAVQPSRSVHSQTEAYKPSVNTQATLKAPVAPQSNTYKPSAGPSTAPASSNVRTGSELNRIAENNIQTQTSDYYSTNAIGTERHEIKSGVGGTPKTVDAVKTASAPTVQGNNYGPKAEPMAGAPVSPNVMTGGEASRIAENRIQTQTENYRSTNAFGTERAEIRSGVNGTPKTVDAVKTTSAPAVQGGNYGPKAVPQAGAPVSPNVMTGSEASRIAESRIQTQTENYRSTNAVGTERHEIKSISGRTPKVVNAVKTASAPAEPGSAYRPRVPMVGAGVVGTATLSSAQVFELKANAMRMGATEKVTAGSAQYSASAARAVLMTQSAKGNNAIRTLAEGKAGVKVLTRGSAASQRFTQYLGAVAKYTVSNEAAAALQNWKAGGRSNLLSGGTFVLGKAEGVLVSSDDLGTQGAGGVIAAGMMGKTAFQASQQVSAVGVEAVKRVGNGVYQVTTTAGLASITVGRTAKTVIERQAVGLSSQTIAILREQAKVSGLADTRLVKGIVNKVDRVKTAYHNAIGSVRKVRNTVVGGARAVKTAVDTSVKIVHGVATGTLTLNVTKASLVAFRNRAWSGIKTGFIKGAKNTAAYAVRGAAKGASVAAFKVVPKAGKLLKGGIMTAAGAMMGSEDMAVQGVGYTITAADIGIKTAVVGTKATGYAVKTGVKGGRAVYAGAKFIKNQGLRAAWQQARVKAIRAVTNMGKSVVSALIAGAKALAMKGAIPLLLICVIVMALSGSLSTLTTAFGTIFGGVFDTSDTNTEQDVREYLLDGTFGVPALADAYIDNIVEDMEESDETYDIIRFYCNTDVEGEVHTGSKEEIEAVFPTDEVLATMLQPMFNTVLLMNYELEISEDDAEKLINDLFTRMFRLKKETSEEQCGQSIENGEGTVTTHACGSVHALDDCPNYKEDTHTSFTCDECDSYYYTCNGHRGRLKCGKEEHTHNTSCEDSECSLEEHKHIDWRSASSPGCYKTSKHSGELSSPCGNSTRHFRCDGYKNCDGHKVISYTLNIDGVYALEQDYFRDPINLLSNKNPRTDEEEKQLENLKGYYEIFQELMVQTSLEYGGGLTMKDLEDINFIYGDRKGNQAVVNLALSQVGQQGGQPYWYFYGFRSRVEWCACFVHWCMRKTPSATDAYPQTDNNAWVYAMERAFKQMGQWGDKNYTNLVAGDTILFDWEQDGKSDHIGIVIGQDGNYVYTVEGNSGDAVQLRKYRIGADVIYGYGLMKYQ